MTLKNLTQKNILTNNLIEAKSFAAQSKGLLAYDKPQTLLIKTRFGIHTFFMRYPIDVVILDKQNRVVKLKENMKPNRMFLWNPKYETVLELPQGTILKTQTKLHDLISMGNN